MEKIIHIEGMGCSGCENRVKKALEALPQVAQAQVSKNSKTAKVTLNEALGGRHPCRYRRLRREVHRNGC